MNLVLKIPFIGVAVALLSGISLFIIDIFEIGNPELHAIIEALSLILIGLSFISLCFTICRGQDRYHWRMVMGITFCLWGVEAIMPQGLGKLLVSDLVVLLFILDLVLIILERSQIIIKSKKWESSYSI